MVQEPHRVTYQWELFSDTIREALPLAKHHWEETEGHGDLDLDLDAYYRLQTAGLLHVFTVRRENRLIGYLIYSITPDIRKKTVLRAAGDFFLDPLEREGLIGYNLIKKSELRLKELGVKFILLSFKLAFLSDNGLTMEKFFKRLGYNPQSVVNVKEL